METCDKKTRLLELIKKEAVFKGDYTLSSGKKSSHYIDLRLITLNAEGAYLIAELVYDLLKDTETEYIGGLTLGADPICGAVAAISHTKGRPISAFIVRKQEKKHGKNKTIEGPLKKGSKVAVIDDVATSGGSLIQAINAVEKEDCKITKVIALVDRDEGAKENLQKEGHSLTTLYAKEDLGL